MPFVSMGGVSNGGSNGGSTDLTYVNKRISANATEINSIKEKKHSARL